MKVMPAQTDLIDTADSETKSATFDTGTVHVVSDEQYQLEQ
jgi:hypothetical protein